METSRVVTGVVYAVVMAAVIVGVDLLLFRDRSGARLIANICIVVAFAAFYWAFLKRP